MKGIRRRTEWVKFFSMKRLGTPVQLRQLSIRLLIFAQVIISWFVNSSPTSHSALTVQSLLGFLSPSLSAPLSLALYLSLKIKINFKKSLNGYKEKYCIMVFNRKKMFTGIFFYKVKSMRRKSQFPYINKPQTNQRNFRSGIK